MHCYNSGGIFKTHNLNSQETFYVPTPSLYTQMRTLLSLFVTCLKTKYQKVPTLQDIMHTSGFHLICLPPHLAAPNVTARKGVGRAAINQHNRYIRKLH